MKINTAILTLLFIYCLTSSFQCKKCGTATLKLDNTKTWLPLKGKTQLKFVDNTGNLTDFQLRVVDTTETALNDCGEPYRYEYINATLYLNPSLTDSIHFSLASSGWLCMSAWSNNNPNVSMCNVFGQTKEARVAKRFSNYPVGARTYQEVILLLSIPGYSDNIDSIIIANHAGVVGFKYATKNYVLQ